MIKISFIVPVYNVAPYLRMCVASLLSQDIPQEDYEIILVEDGSTDSSPEICDEYDRMFANIHAIHQPNRGLSAARNAGIAAAKGEYICFVDSDDYWQHNVLAGLIAQIERDHLDVLRFKYQNVNEDGEVFNPYKHDRRLENDYSEVPTDGVSFLNSRINTQCYAVMFIVKRALLDKCIFTPGIYFEDTDWTPRMLREANRVASSDTVVYNYLVRQGSISRAIDRTKQQKVLDDKIRLITALQQQAIELKNSGRYNRWYRDMISDTVVSVIGMLSIEFYTDKDSYLEKLKEMNIYPIESKSFKARLINLSPKLAVRLLHVKNKK